MTGLPPAAPPGPVGSCTRPGGQGTLPPAGLIALLLLLAVIPYIDSLQNGFVYDNNNEVLTNPSIRSFRHLDDIFSTRIPAHLDARGATNYYRPISILGFLLCYKLVGLLPYGFHLPNLLLYGLMVCLLCGLAKGLFQNLWLGLVAAAALAPLSVQARNELGHFYFTHGRWAGVEEQFHSSVASIANTTAYDGIGDTNVCLGRPDVAEQAYRQALALDDAVSHGHFGLAALLASTGREGEALAHYQAGLRLDPLNPEARTAFERLKSNSSHVNPSNK